MIINEEKLNNILQRQGYFLLFLKKYMKLRNISRKVKGVISSKNFNKESLEKLFTQFI